MNKHHGKIMVIITIYVAVVYGRTWSLAPLDFGNDERELIYSDECNIIDVKAHRSTGQQGYKLDSITWVSSDPNVEMFSENGIDFRTAYYETAGADVDPTNAMFSFRLVFPNLIEFEDKDTDGVYDVGDDVIIQQVSLQSQNTTCNPIITKLTSSAAVLSYVTEVELTTTQGETFSITVEFDYTTYDVQDETGLILTASSMQTRITIPQFPWIQTNTSLAMSTYIIIAGHPPNLQPYDAVNQQVVPSQRTRVEFAVGYTDINYAYLSWVENVIYSSISSAKVPFPLNNGEYAKTLYFTIANNAQEEVQMTYFAGVSVQEGRGTRISQIIAGVVTVTVVVVSIIVAWTVLCIKRRRERRKHQSLLHGDVEM